MMNHSNTTSTTSTSSIGTTTTTTITNVPLFLSVPSSLTTKSSSSSSTTTDPSSSSPNEIPTIINCLNQVDAITKLTIEYKLPTNQLLTDSEYSELNNTITFIKSSLQLYSKVVNIGVNASEHRGNNKLTSSRDDEIKTLTVVSSGDQCFRINLRRVYTLLTQLNGSLIELKKLPRHLASHIVTQILKNDSLLKQSVDQLLALFPMPPNITDSSTIPLFNPVTLLPTEAKEMWIKKFGDNVSLVPWSIFFKSFQSYFNTIIGTIYEVNFRHIIDFSQDGYVSPYKLVTFLKWFGPFPNCINNLIDSISAKIMSGFVSGVEATRYLEKKSSGHYIIRFSKTYPGAFAVTFVENSNNIRHCLLYPVNTGLTLLQPPDIFKNLTGFVLGFSSRLKYAIGPVESSLFPPSDESIEVPQLPPRSFNDTIIISSSNENSNNNNSNNTSTTSTLSNNNNNNNNNNLSTISSSPNSNFISESVLSKSPTKSNSRSSSPNGGSSSNSSSESNSPHSSPLPKRKTKKKDRSGSSSSSTNSTSSSTSSLAPSSNPVQLPTGLTEKDICVVCMDNVINTVFLECGHLSCCLTCSSKLRTCPICRKPISRVITIFRSN